ncbi:MAG TPA: sigma 54-interacting transcriptional regulator [Thermoanaerobaculia bacterium]|nr:sigma 54-interacting transcriptional regulator [Thermoanaerobaculia bacterium]
MNMRGSARRGRVPSLVRTDAFGWDRALMATLRHASLPWGEALEPTTPLESLRDLGTRDRLSLVAQFAAHQALLQFAGIADGELDAAEWAAVQKRGSDVRLVRMAARACDASVAPPVLTLAQQFAEHIGAELDILRETWARADAIYAEAFARVSRDAAADLRWMRRSACGAIAAPGPDGLRALLNEHGRFGYRSDDCVDAVQRFAELEGSLRVTVYRGASPLERYSALAFSDRSLEPSAVAERILGMTSAGRHVFVVAGADAFDEGSRQVVELLANAKHGTWLIPGDANGLADARPFLIAPRLAARAALDVAPHEFVDSPAFAAYLADGDGPPRRAALPDLGEPARSYIGALALLGSSTSRAEANSFLGDFLFHGELAELVVDGVTALDETAFAFANEAVREEATRLIPAASRPAICRVAATYTAGIRAALLWLDAGNPAAAADVLERTEWASAEETIAALHRVPMSVLTPTLARRFAHALIDCGRYRDARDLGVADEFVLARAERRMGDYATALARLDRVDSSFETQLLRAELLRLLEREEESSLVLEQSTATNDEERACHDYERALHEIDAAPAASHYLAARLATYRAVERHDYDEAARCARQAHTRARNTIERIDASLDRLFAIFSAGEWDLARAVCVEALHEVEETQGDRAAGGILFTLAYLAADAGQWAHASQRIARLRQYYTSNGDMVRLAELQLLTAHLDFSRGRFGDARRAAHAVYQRRGHHDQIREAAALILDELDVMEGNAPRHSTGKSGNAELTRRHRRLRGDWQQTAGDSVPAKLIRFRAAVANGDANTARSIATELDLTFDAAPAPTEIELRLLRAAATRDFPFATHDFDVPWCFATRNRLGQWNASGSYAPPSFDHLDATRDWTACSDREYVYIEGSSSWTTDGREAVAAIFRTRAANHRFHRILEQEEHANPPRIGAGAIEGIVGQSPAIREIESLVARISRRDVAVCILGESGTGKELVARAIHRQSPRRSKTFTAVNCAALPENLVESELFGHVRGAFTGADRDRAGLIETTDGGTLFLDEVGELPLQTQAKLLRFLQEGEFRRVGDTVNRSADVRIVSATNRKLDTAVEEGRFRDDLYYRIRGVEIALPALRERGNDIALLATHFLNVERTKHRSGPTLLSADSEAIFTAYAWPGNVRELQNTIRAAHAMAGESAREIEVEHLPERLRNVAPSRTAAGSYQHAVTRFKRDLIERSLAESSGNQNRAAAMLKMSRQALAYQIRELGIMVR